MQVKPLATLSLLVFASACGTGRPPPNIARIYKEAALDKVRNPVIVIHGVLGAQLRQRSTNKIVWGAFTSEGIDPNSPEGARAVALPIKVPESAMVYDPDKEDVYPAGPLGQLELSVLYQVLSVNVYAEILRTLGAGGYTDQLVNDPLSPLYAEDHYSCFTFFYDWRRDNVENAIRLGYFIEEKRKEVDLAARAKVERLRASGKPEELQEADAVANWLAEGYNFDIVAHSMGGLIARYYLRYGKTDLPADGSLPEITWEGAQNVDRLVMVGTPNLGSMDAMRNLQHGFKPAWILPRFGAALLCSMPSLYQLLPRVRHKLIVDGQDQVVDLDFFDPEVWKQNKWGLMSAEAEKLLAYLLPDLATAEARRAQAFEYLSWCLNRASAFHAALDRPVEGMPSSEVFLFAGDAENTLIKAKQENWGGLSFDERRLYGDGDGTVARYSSLADERFGGGYRPWLESPVPWSNVTFLADDHIGLTKNPHFTDNMLFLLLERRPMRKH